jgi:PIN domain-containing protein
MDTKTKQGNDKYGDLVLWLQVIEYAKKEHKSIILVTGENKEDWWKKEKGKIVSPRPELINEIHDEAGVAFYLYQSAQFLEYAQKFLNLADQRAAVQEVEEISRQDEAIETAVDYFATKDWIDRRVLNNFGALDNVLLRRATEAANLLENPLTRNAIESARLFDRTFHNPVLRRALEDVNAIKTPLINENLERARATHSSSALRHLEELSRLVNDPASRRAGEISQMLNNPTMRQMSDAQAAFTNPFLRDHLEAARFWANHTLRGWPLPRDIEIEVLPKRSSDPPTTESSKVRVEIILSDAEDDSDSEPASGEADVDSAPPYEFNNYPRVITLTHRRDSSHPFETSHRLRRPTNDEWNSWGQSIKRNRRYFSAAEIDEHNADREEDEKASEIWSPFYSEWEANESLYNNILLEIAGVHLDSNDEFPRDQFRLLPTDIIGKLQFEMKSAVITALYECYCEIEKSGNDQTGRIKQELMTSSLSPNVTHILRKPTELESLEFRTTIVTGEFAQDKEGREIIQLRLNLSVANDFYNSLINGIENATVGGKVFSAETRAGFLDVINPVYKLRVLEPLFGVRAWYFKVDDIVFP